MKKEEKEYKVEYTQVSKSYAAVVVLARSPKEAIDKVRKLDLKLEDYDENETASQAEWTASNKFSIIEWIKKVIN